MKRNRRAGYTLVELAIGLGVFAVLAVIFFPDVLLSGGSRHGERNVGYCRRNLKQIGLGFLQYVQDNDERLPPIAINSKASGNQAFGWADALQPYVKSTQIFHCSAQKTVPESNDATQKGYTDYWFNTYLDAFPIQKISAPEYAFLAGEGSDGKENTNARYDHGALPESWLKDANSPSHRHNGYANYLFVDGHVKSLLVETIPENDWFVAKIEKP